MKILYIANIRIPTEKAHGIQIMNTCAALARAGGEVELVVPRRRNTITSDPFDFYGLKKSFAIRNLFSIDLISLGALQSMAFALQSLTFSISVFLHLLFGKSEGTRVIYGRDELVLSFVSLFSKKVYWETHIGSMNIFARILLKRARGIVCITKGLANAYIEKGLDRERILVAPDAVDLGAFDAVSDNIRDLRRDLGLPESTELVTYSGSIGLYSWKGADVFLDAARMTADKNVRFMLIGGSEVEIKKLKAEYADTNVLFIGRVNPSKIPFYLKASDALVIPNKVGSDVSEKYTSPMKLFEYMASKRAIIASDLPSIREIIGNEDALFFRAGDAQDLARKIEEALNDKNSSSRKAQAAYAKVKGYTWDKRASQILNFLDNSTWSQKISE